MKKENDDNLRLAAQQLAYMAEHNGEESEELKLQDPCLKNATLLKPGQIVFLD